MHRLLHYTLGVFLLLAPLGWADDDHGKGKAKGKDNDSNEERDEGRRADLFKTQVVKIVDLGTGGLGPGFAVPGADVLREGEVLVKSNRRIEIDLQGAPANTAYNVFFCRFVTFNSCFGLVPATLTTNAGGNFQGKFEFTAATGNVIAGVFLFTRGGNVQFISGMQLPAAPVDLGVEIDLKGTISSINGTNQTLRLETFPVDITVNSSTKFSGLDRFADLRVGQTVEVEGIAAAGGVTASRIKLKD